MKRKIEDYLIDVKTVGITGHIRPDGDCAGSCLALYNYLKKNFSHLETDLYLEPVSEKFHFLHRSQEIKSVSSQEKEYDIFIVLDSSDLERIGDAVKYFNNAKTTLCIDHHVSNSYFAAENIISAEASSASEVLYHLFEDEKIDKETAQCIYTGIIYDSGVFKYSSTSEETMCIAGKMMSYGIPFGKIIDESFYSKSYNQNKLLGNALLESSLALGDKCIYTVVTREHMAQFGVSDKELDGIVDQLRLVKGVECAIFLYETKDSVFKVSLRSNDYVDVNKVAGEFGGGGHIRAAGCTIGGDVQDSLKKLLFQLEKQI